MMRKFQHVAALAALAGTGMLRTQGGGKETIEVKRRRQGTTGGPEAGRRAEAPQRRRPRATTPGGGGGGFGTGGGTGGLGTGGGTFGGGSSGGRQLPIWLVILIIVGYGLYTIFAGGGDQTPSAPTDGGLPPLEQSTPLSPQVEEPQPQEPLPGVTLPTPIPMPTATRRPAAQASGDTTWTVMLYQDADDQILEHDIYLDLNEAEKIGSTERVSVVAQVDRYRGAFTGDGDWTGARRYYITQDDDLNRVTSELVEEIGEANMADHSTLSGFITWAVERYPADRYALILSDHGTGWPGGWSDGDSGGSELSSIPIVSRLDDNLFLMEISQSLEEARAAAGIDRFELVGMDACLMGHLEVFAMLEPHARFAVASQETEPALGWAYASFLQSLADNPDQDGGALGEQIVASYIQEDQRIVDEDARAEFLRQGSPLGGLFRPQQVDERQLAAQLGRDVTLTAVDLSALPALMESVNALAVTLQDEDQSVVASARSYAQSFTNIFSRGGPAPYIDLGHFAQLLAREGRGAQTAPSARAVIQALGGFIVAERHGPGKPGATGVSIYFPNGTLYSSPVAGPQSYTAVARRFAETSLWDDFLAYHYNDVPVRADQNAIAAPQGGASRAPGSGGIQVSALALSSDVAAPGQPVRISADITGQNIGYIYFFAGFYDAQANAIYVADTDYLESPETRELNGVYYPVWSQNETFTLAMEWEPTVFEIQNGDQRVVALFTPREYGADAAQAVYTVEGVFHYADGQSRTARLYFQDGALTNVFGFTEGEAGAPREIIPTAGDSFTVAEKWLDLDASGQVEQTAYEDGETLTFGEDVFRLGEVFAAPGEYVIGLIVEDLEGQSVQSYSTVTVQ